ncbi:MAG TPA: hypothetical protein VFA68_16445 [Terriglobales bacterium]|nr:hypothetical protein [Terriglobales bacterium]
MTLARSSLAMLAVCLLSFSTVLLRATEAPRPGNFDGPAELPRVYMNTDLSATPSPGRHIQLKDPDNLQEALESASCGDTLELHQGATYRGLFKLPAKRCDDAHWITIRTSAADSELPHEGTRLTPCYAGVASLPGRPDFHCPAPKNVMARIVFPARNGSGPLLLENGANHYRFIGLEITRDPDASVYNLLSGAKGGTADHLVFDRVWMHGTAQDETNRGLLLSGMMYVGVVDSYFSDFHCTARSGACVDAQAIAGGLGSNPMGIYKISNNFLEGAAETIIFGGGPATEVPADIEIRRNYMFKPWTWMPGHPQFVGAANGNPFIVKNLFELKNAQRVLLEGNIMENTWGGFSQAGYGVVLTPKNQVPNVCPLCQVTDITIRYCRISHVGSGFQIGNGLSDTGGAAKAGERYSIHDVVVDDIQGKPLKGFGVLAQVSMAAPTLHDVFMDHITAFPPDSVLLIGGPRGENRMFNFTLTNSIVYSGDRQVTTTGGGPKNCSAGADKRGPAEVLDQCFGSYAVHHNAIIGGGSWPKGNMFPRKPGDVQFVNFANGKDGDYSLSGRSKFKRAGSDGKDLGADIDAIRQATAGVQ